MAIDPTEGLDLVWLELFLLGKACGTPNEIGPFLIVVFPDSVHLCQEILWVIEYVRILRRIYLFLSNSFLGPQELKVLVDLAIISAGEADMETYKITCLHTSCLGFAPLIFDLEPTFGFEELMEACKPVWNAVDADPTLPKKLVGLFSIEHGEIVKIFTLSQVWWDLNLSFLSSGLFC